MNLAENILSLEVNRQENSVCSTPETEGSSEIPEINVNITY
jgi:hypothetical protein